MLVDVFLEAEALPGEIVLDLGTTDDTWQRVDSLVATFSSNECANYPASAGYNSSKA